MSIRRWIIAGLAALAVLTLAGVALVHTPGVHWYNNYTSFAFFLDNSNWPPYFLAALLPGLFIYAWTHWLHRKQMRKMHEHHVVHLAEMAKVHETLGKIHRHQTGEPPQESSDPDPV